MTEPTDALHRCPPKHIESIGRFVPSTDRASAIATDACPWDGAQGKREFRIVHERLGRFPRRPVSAPGAC